MGGLAFFVGGIITGGLGWLIDNFRKSNEGGIISTVSLVIILLLVVFTFSLYVRRLHDLNKTGWLSLLLLVPLVNFILIVVLLLKPGTSGGNKYGLPPRGYKFLLQDLFAL